MRIRILARSACALLLASLVVGSVASVALADPCPEPNDSVATACRLEAGAPLQGTLDSNTDVDAYAFDVPTGATMVHATLGGLPADYDLNLVGNDGTTVIAQSITTGLDDERIEQPLGPGRYYLFVTAFGAASADQPYTLSLTIDAPPPPTATATPAASPTPPPPPTATPIPPTPTPVTGWIAPLMTTNAAGDAVLPHGVALGPQGNLFVADYDGNHIQIYAPDGYLLGRMGQGEGGVAGKLRHPDAVAVDAQGVVYVADADNHRVQAFSPDGQSIGLWGRTGELQTPSGVAVDAQGNVYVTDKDAHRVQKFAPNGDVLAVWGRPGNQPGEFSTPRGVAVDMQGNVYVADTGNNRIQKLGPDGAVLATWGLPNADLGNDNEHPDGAIPTQEPGRLDAPQGIALDAQGNVYVADYGNNRVQRFDPAGNATGAWGEPGGEIGQLSHPSDVALDGQGTLYVADRDNVRIQRLVLPPAPTATPTAGPTEAAVSQESATPEPPADAAPPAEATPEAPAAATPEAVPASD